MSSKILRKRHRGKDIGLVNVSDVLSFSSRPPFAGKIKRKPMQFFGCFLGDPHGFCNRNIGFDYAPRRYETAPRSTRGSQ